MKTDFHEFCRIPFNNGGPETLLLYYLLSLLLAETIRIDSRRIYSDKTPENCETFNFEFT